MSSPLQNLPEDHLLSLLPGIVTDRDVSGIVAAVVGGIQDRLSDLRSYAGFTPNLISAWAPAQLTVVLVVFTTPAGVQLTRSLDITADTPSDPTKLIAWAAEQMQVDLDVIQSATAGTDLLRQLGVDTVQLLSRSLGEALYPGLTGEDPTSVRVRQQQAVDSYFPRLKIKGTSQSFTAVARLAGFDDAAYVPLWTRGSPRDPLNPGSDANFSDMAAVPDYYPTPELPDSSGAYDPAATCDGPFFEWSSGTLSPDPASPNYYLKAVNGANPFIRLRPLGALVENPPPGDYELAGGAPLQRASVILSDGTTSGNMAAEAIYPGGAFNGLVIRVRQGGSIRTMDIDYALSSVKYRSSMFDMVVMTTAPGTVAADTNADLYNNPALLPDGVATAPFRPWGGGTIARSHVETWPTRRVVVDGTTVAPRIQVYGTVSQLDAVTLAADAQRVLSVTESVTAATRRPRHLGYGPETRDVIGYAPYVAGSVLFVAPPYGSSGGLVSVPEQTTEAAFTLNGTTSVTAQILQDGTVQFASVGLAGSLNFSTGLWRATTLAPFSGTLSVGWSGLSTEIVRPTPLSGLALAYLTSPEGTVTGSDIDIDTVADDVSWTRPLLAGGEIVDANIFLPYNGDPDVTPADISRYAARDLSGVLHECRVRDGLGIRTPPPVVVGPEAETSPELLAVDAGGTLVEVCAPTPTTLVSAASWDARKSGIALWWPLMDHRDDPLAVASAVGPDPDVENLRSRDRVYSSGGWALRLSEGTVSAPAWHLPEDEFSAMLRVNLGLGTYAGNMGGYLARLGGITIRASGTAAVAVDVLGTAGDIRTTSVGLPAGQWGAVLLSSGGSCVHVTPWSVSGWGSTASVSGLPASVPGATLRASYTEGTIQDLTVWNARRTPADTTPVVVPVSNGVRPAYRQSYVTGVHGGRWGLLTLASGAIVPELSDVGPLAERLGTVHRYRGDGRYDGNPAFNQVGLGGAQALPTIHRLGYYGAAIPASGGVVLAGTNSEPGYASSWLTSGSYVSVRAPYGSNGGQTTSVAAAASVWPPALPNYNGAYDRVYLPGVAGSTWQVSLDDVGKGVMFVTNLPLRPRPERESYLGLGPREIVTDFESKLSKSTNSVSSTVTVNATGTVTGSDNAPLDGDMVTESVDFIVTEDDELLTLESLLSETTLPLYLYLRSRLKVSATNAFSRWVNRNSFGVSLGVPALNTAGVLDFDNAEALPAGNYRVAFDAGNIGTLDQQFTGFRVLGAIVSGPATTTTFEADLLTEASGTNPRGTSYVEFALATAVPAGWRLSLEWTNPRSVPSRGERRQLAIYGYTFRRVATELFQILTGPLQIVPVDISDNPTSGTLAAGAWRAQYNSYGTVCSLVHEANLYSPAISAYESGAFNPVAATLSGSTLERRGWVEVLNAGAVPAAGTHAAPSSLGLFASPTPSWYNVGDVVTFSAAVGAGNPPYRYVWRMGDSGTVATTAPSSGTLVVNQGGTLPVELTVVDDAGQSARTRILIPVNYPPVISLATASVTSAPAPYTTTLSAVAFDPEGDTFAVTWERGGTQVASGPVVSGYLVTESQVIRCVATDDRGGRATADLPLVAASNAAPIVSIVAVDPTRLKADVTVPQTIRASGIVKDPENRGVSSLWRFWNGVSVPGQLAPMRFFGGGTYCTMQRDVTNQPVGRKELRLQVTDVDGNTTTSATQVEFVANGTPRISHLSADNPGVVAGMPIILTAVAVDPDGDAVKYTWTIDGAAAPLTLYGPNAVIDTTNLTGRTLTAMLTVEDDWGAAVTAVTSPVTVYATGLTSLTISPAGGGGLTVGATAAITSPDSGTTIVYTLDDSDPMSPDAGLVYAGPVTIPYAPGTAVVLSARAFKDGVAPSPLVRVTYSFAPAQ